MSNVLRVLRHRKGAEAMGAPLRAVAFARYHHEFEAMSIRPIADVPRSLRTRCVCDQ